MFCPNCGAEIPSDQARFCKECGTPLAASTPLGAPTPRPESDAQPISKPAEDGAPLEEAGAEGQPKSANFSPTPGVTPEAASASGTPLPARNAEEPAPAAPRPSAQGPADSQGPRPPARTLAIAGAAVVALGVIIALVVFLPKAAPSGSSADSGSASASAAGASSASDSGSGAASSSSASASSSAAPSPDDGLTPQERRAFYEGKWVAQDSSDPRRPAGWFQSKAAEGVYYTLTLWDDGTGVFRTADGPEKISWEADSMTEAHTVIDGKDMTIALRSKKLTLTNPDGIELYFVPESEVDLSNAVDLSQHGHGVTVDPSTIEVGEYLKLIGNESIGYLQIPQQWANRTDALPADDVKSYDALYYADETTEYTSQDGYGFTLSVQASRHSGSYEGIAQQLYEKYDADANFGPVTKTTTTVGKRRAIMIETSDKSAGVNTLRVVIDRDNDEKVSVVLAFNCGPIGDSQKLEWCRAYVTSWQVE